MVASLARTMPLGSEVVRLTALGLLEAYAARDVSPVDVVDALAERISGVEPVLKAFITLTLDEARDDAKRAERAYSRQRSARRLEGVPVAVKDLLDTAGVRTTYGSPMFLEHVPDADAEAVRRAKAAGAIVVGKTSTHEFAWGITSYNPHFDSGRNPWAPDRVSGGSSGGSAVALATHEAPLALGSDTGGSIRAPAALCGIVGLKPTYGLVSTSGVFPLAPSLDHVGPMARTPADAALLFSVLVGGEAGGVVADELLASLHLGIGGVRIGICPDLMRLELLPDVRAVFDAAGQTLRELGAEVVDVVFPEAGEILPTFAVIEQAEARRVHEGFGLFPARRDEYGEDVRERVELAGKVTFEDYVAASTARERIRAGFVRAFQEVDLLLTPVSAVSPVVRGEDVIVHLDELVPFEDCVLTYTTPQDVAGLPACAVRAGFDKLGIPVGIQFTGPAGAEPRVLRAAQAFWAATSSIQARSPDLESWAAE